MIPNFTVFGRELSAYMICAIVGVVVVFFFLYFTAPRYGANDVEAIFLLLCAAFGGIIGAKILYCLTNLSDLQELLALWNTLAQSERLDRISKLFGGGVYYGSLLGGMLTGWLYLKLKKLDMKPYADLSAVGIPLFHGIGRLGCFLTGCCYGVECKVGFVYHYAPHAAANGVRRFPVQLVEMSLNFGLFFLLLYLLQKGRAKGRLLQLYLLIYPIYRFVLEFFRGDDYRGFLFGLSTSQIISILILLGNLIFTLCTRNVKKKEASPC